MASRRTRIKGIANIPQRKRNVPVQENDNPTNTHEDEETTKQLGLGLAIPDSGSQLANDVPSCNPLQPKELNSNTSDRRAGDSVVVDEHKLFQNVNILNKNSDKVLVKSVENQSVIQNDGSLKLSVLGEPVLPQKTSIKRRTFIKPEVSAAARNKKPKISDKNRELVETIKDGNKSESGLGDTFESTLENGSGEKLFSNTVTNVSHELTLDEVHLTAQIRSEQELPQDKDVKRILPIINHAPNSDTEYPPPPPSPSKISRSRIKAIPRLGYRKTSFSASESEDESKRNYNRNRNDSVCSTTSGVPESIADCMSPQRPRELNSIAQKKCNRTEQSRKLAEARREFQRRFGSNKPDKQKLTMIDLIFYNPASNPMTAEIVLQSIRGVTYGEGMR
ncbi:hypothetical protein NQ315_005045 [Exocentrus adspersus]|uniref:Uncharacterized protein n=1 Tax=Exocentrus adspersus TaxID=1586481 RepID=A0AAV8VPZ2_9CUCU|nr:hypothetical protein NQ315_005045 [Exocentrus adspersus]